LVLKDYRKFLVSTIAILIIGMTTAVYAQEAAEPGTDGQSETSPPISGIVSPLSLDLVDNGGGVTFTGKGGYSADGMGANDNTGTVSADIPAGSTIVQAILYATTNFGNAPVASVDVTLDGTPYTLDDMTQSEYNGCCALQSFKFTSGGLTAQVAAKFASDGPGVINFAVVETNNPGGEIDGTALVVIFSNPASPDVSVAILDGGLSVTPALTTVFFAEPLDTAGLEATLALGIGFGFQFSDPDFNDCTGNQRSSVDINGLRLTTCAGGSDDREADELTAQDGNLFTVGGFDDSPTNPIDPFAISGVDDELYNLVPFVTNGDTQLDITTENFSADDIIFLAIVEINRVVSLTCGDLIVTPPEECDPPDGTTCDAFCMLIPDECQIDSDCDDGQFCTLDSCVAGNCVLTPNPDPSCEQVGGEFIGVDNSALLVAGFQANALWLLPAIAAIGIAAVVIRRIH